MTTKFNARNTATSTTAIPMASLNPFRNTAPSSATRNRVRGTWLPWNHAGANGFSRACAVASAAERVIVIMKSVAPKPAPRTIPVWIGGHTPRALRRVAELGDGWHAAFPSAAQMKSGLADLATACRTVGRDLKSLTLSARLGLPARQDADALVGEIRELADLGVSHLILE